MERLISAVKRILRVKHWQAIACLLVFYDVIAVNLSYFMGLFLRFDAVYSQIPSRYLQAFRGFAPIYTVFCICIFYLLRMYRSIWQFASYYELIMSMTANMLTLIIQVLGTTLFFQRMPFSYYFFGFICQAVFVIGVRFAYRMVLFLRPFRKKAVDQNSRRVMIVGAGSAGQMILRDINSKDSVKEDVACFIDDNPNKINRYVEGVIVAGDRHSIPDNVKKYNIKKIYIAIPSLERNERKEIVSICSETSCELKILPTLYHLANEEVGLKQMKDVSVEDLLGREEINPNLKEVYEFINNKVILVTGGGGSIGSEICRQVASHNPKQLIIFDIYENNAYDIQLELRDRYPELNLEVIIGSVRDSRKLNDLFSTYKPDIVYHAAAHKHVPLMEDSPNEAIKNNTIGTYKTAYAAMMNGVKRFVLISTDKAVNPTNVMGASKRLCEMVIQAFDKKIKEKKADEIPVLFTHEPNELDDLHQIKKNEEEIKTEFVAVRFGNVLASNGSVIPVFRKQIERGGPVTVTHPDIIRYFMTIPEATSLVLQAGTYAHGGEIFVLDMGEPVKIDKLARDMIRLSGYEPDVDIPIKYIGLRPGEKLYEERLMDEEGLETTPSKRISIAKPINFDADVFLSQIKELIQAAYENDPDIRERIEKIVPTYHPN